MSQNRTKTLLAAWILAFLAAAPALGQGLQDMQMFAPAEMSTYGGGPRPNEGFFFGFDGLIWSRSAPKTTTIGFEGATRSVIMWEQDPPAPNPLDRERVVQSNTQNTGVLKSEPEGGQRYEFGYVNGHHGWMTSILKLSDHAQEFMASDVGVVFSDPPFGSQPLYSLQGFIDAGLTTVDDLAVIFDQIDARNVIETWGVELNYIYRMHPCAQGGILEILLGARYLEFDEAFNVEAVGGNLADSFWNTQAENHIVGPQVGIHWFRKTGRWTWSTEARGFFGYNSQNFFQEGQLGSLLDPVLAGTTPLTIRNMPPTEFSSGKHEQEWSPAAELRVEFAYQLTRAVSAKVGWTGFWIDGIARASNSIDYEVPRMGLDLSNNDQWMFMNGVTFGFEVNR